MTVRTKLADPDPRLIVAQPRWLRTKAPIRWVLQFGLRTVFAVLLLMCVALTVAYYSYFRTRRALAGPTLYLHANDTVSLSRKADQPLSDESLPGVLERSMKRYRAAAGESADRVERAGWTSWENPYGPPVTVVAHPQARHGALDSLLHTCVDQGFERYVLTDATNRQRSFSFVLVKDRVGRGFPDSHSLPPVILYMWATEDGSLKSLRANQRKFQSLAKLRKWIIDVVGPERGPRSIHNDIELQMRCDTNLDIRHVFDAQAAVAGYKTRDGKWVSLLEKVRPVRWGAGLLDLDEIEYEDKEFSDRATSDTTDPAIP